MNEQEYYNYYWKLIGDDFKNRPEIVEKAGLIAACIPGDVASILDVGCGDGSITNVLGEKYKVIGTDISPEAVKLLSPKVAKIIGNADSLPFKDNCVDLVLSSELLEHLPAGSFYNAISEIKRTGRKYILISVPNNEKLRKRYTKCSSCGYIFHVYNHVRCFNLSGLAVYFKEYNIKYTALCGVPDVYSYNSISYFKNIVIKDYFIILSAPMICSMCGSVLKFSQRNFLQKAASFLLNMLTTILNLIFNKKPALDWLIVLFEKK